MFLLLFVCSISGFAQRGGENNIKGNNTAQNADFFKMPDYRGLSNQEGLMVFQDQRTFDYVYDDLVKRVEAWNRTVFKEEVNPPVLRGTDCFEDNDVLYFFENNYKFFSQRKQFLVQECEMLEKGVHPARIPDSWIIDDILQAFLSPQNAVQIGKSIFLLKEEGLTYEVTNGDRRILNALIEGVSPSKFKNVSVIAETRDLECSAAWVLGGSDGLTANFNFTGFPNAISNDTAQITYHWTFGDNGTSSDENPTHTYSSLNTYNVCLTIQVRDGEEYCEDRQCQAIDLEASCHAAFIYDQVGGVPGKVCFTDLSELLSGDEIESWTWNFGNDVPESTEKNPCTTFSCNDEYQVKLKIKTKYGCESEFGLFVDVTSHYCCGSGFAKDQVEYQGGDRLIKYKQKEKNFLGRGPRARMKNYKRRNFGNGWKKTRGDLRIDLIGNVYKDDGSGCSCQNDIDITGTKTGNNKKKLVYRKATGSGKISSKEDDKWSVNYKVSGNLIKHVITEVTCDN